MGGVRPICANWPGTRPRGSTPKRHEGWGERCLMAFSRQQTNLYYLRVCHGLSFCCFANVVHEISPLPCNSLSSCPATCVTPSFSPLWHCFLVRCQHTAQNQSKLQGYAKVVLDPKWNISWKYPDWQVSGVRLQCLANKSGWVKAFG